MPIKNKIGYDTIDTYTEEELVRVYKKEGLGLPEAKIKAREVFLAINKMASSERRLWASVRENEITVGADPGLMEDYNA